MENQEQKDVPIIEKANQTRGTRPACKQQVYSEEIVAQTMATHLLKLGVDASVEHCPLCGMIHVKELRPQISTKAQRS